MPIDTLSDDLGLTDSESHSELTRLVKEATSLIENRYGIAVMEQTLVLYMQTWFEWPFYRNERGLRAIELPRPPFSSVTSVFYLNADGDSTEWTAGSTGYDLGQHGVRARIRPAYNVNWPTLRSQMDAVTITWVAGASAYTAVPAQIQHAIRALVEMRFENDCLPDDNWWHALDQLMIGEDASWLAV